MLYRIFSYLFLFILLPAILPAQTSIIQESLPIESSVLKKNVNYNIYLPKGYEESNRSYPVLYLLHGYTDDEIGWTQFGEVQQIADEASESLSVTDMIIVMPDAGVSWYINNHDGSVNYEDFFTEELIPHVDETYRTRATKEFRAIAGLSMGGYGTLIMATKHSELFTAAAPLSAAVFLDEEISDMPQENWDNALGTPFGEGLEGEDRLTDHYYENSIIEIMENGDQEALKSVDYYIDCGDDDFLIRGNLALYDVMVQNEISAEFRVRDGAHTWDYWRTVLPDVLEFVSARFHR
ncbi:MAG: esterase family protein [Bacteroidetes bacterium]|jgi:S-formylglutathione hydrolase FrmB|nr:esterase family protein [Bacteroidota bacterium]